jgi:hypothetical protein
MDEQTNGHESELPVSTLELLFLTRAYSRGEISYEEWLERSRQWAEAMIRQHSQTEPPVLTAWD